MQITKMYYTQKSKKAFELMVHKAFTAQLNNDYRLLTDHPSPLYVVNSAIVKRLKQQNY